MSSVTGRDATVIGLAQAMALVPGVSRSGGTITAGLFLGLDRESAARCSFLLSVPAVVLSGLFQLLTMLNGSAGSGAGLATIVVATGMAFVSGYWAIAGVLRFLATHSTAVFVAYRIALGALVLVLAATGAIL